MTQVKRTDYPARVKRGDPSVMPNRGPEGVLVHLWQQLLRTKNVDGGKYQQLIRLFVRTAVSTTRDQRIIRRLTPANVRRELERSSMTIKVFFKAIKAMEATSADFNVTIHFKDGTSVTTRHEIKLNEYFSMEDHLGELESTSEPQRGQEVHGIRIGAFTQDQADVVEKLREQVRAAQLRGAASLRRPENILISDRRGDDRGVHAGPGQNQPADVLPSGSY